MSLTQMLVPMQTLGQNGKGPATAQSTFMVFDIGLYVWTTGKPQGFPTMITTTESPNTPKPGKTNFSTMPFISTLSSENYPGFEKKNHIRPNGHS
jgi:hypothetical protein